MPTRPSLDSFIGTTQKPSLDSFVNSTPSQTVDTSGAFFPSVTGESPITAGLKSIGNIPSSALNLAKNIGSTILSPIKTMEGIATLGAGVLEKGGKALGIIPKASVLPSEQSLNEVGNFLKNRYGSIENLQRTATNDPVGFGTDIVSLFTGVAGLAGKGAEATQALSKLGQTITKPIAKGTEFVATGAGKIGKFSISQATGLNPETITELVKNPEAFKTAKLPTRGEVTQAVADSLDTRLSELSGLGKEYQMLRETPQVVTLKPNSIKDVLNKYGVKLDNNNQIITSAESRPLSTGDRVALQDFINTYGKEQVLSSNAFLNVREALSNLAKYDSSKTNLSTTISRDLRSVYDEAGKTQIKGLKELDAQYAPERQLLGQLKKDIFTSQGELKDGAISKIANITGKGKENLLNRVKEIVPDIEQRIKVVKAVEDIERTSGIKVGTYTRTLTQGAGLLGIGTGNIPVIIGAILAQPEIAVPLLKGAGYVGQKARPILNAIKVMANDVNNFKLPPPVLETGKIKK